MKKINSHHKIFFVLIVTIIIAIVGLVSYIRSLEQTLPSSTNFILIISLRTGCGLSCQGAGIIEVYSNKSYKLFKGLEDKEAVEYSGTMSNDDYSKIVSNISKLPSHDSFDDKIFQGADMIESFLYIYDSEGGQKEYSVGDGTLARKDERISEILTILKNLWLNEIPL